MRKKNVLLLLFFSICAAMMLCMTFAKTGDTQFQSAAAEIFDNLSRSLSGKSVAASILTIAFYKLGKSMQGADLPKKWVFKLAACFLALIWLAGESFRVGDALQYISESPGQIVKSGIYLCGASYFIYEAVCLFYKILKEKTDLRFGFQSPAARIWAAGQKHSFAVVVVFLLICWAIPLITCYPANMCNDAWKQLSQFWGYTEFTTHHPPVHTLVIGFFTWLGTKLGSANVGLYLFILFQSTLYTVIIAYAFSLFKKLSAPKWLMLLTLITAAFSPYYANRVGLVLKDNLYSVFVLLFVIELIFALLDHIAFLRSKKHLFLSSVSILGVILFRNNGKYILYPTIAVILLLLVVKLGSLSKQVVLRGLLVLLIPVMAASVINFAVISHYDIQKGSIAEMLSLPFQQTARYVSSHEADVTEQEKEAISAILDYDNLSELYNAKVSDPVKATFNQDATTEELVNYFKVWFRMFFKHPQTYIAATLNQNYFLFYPFQENNTVYVAFDGSFEEIMAPLKTEVGLTENKSLQVWEQALEQWNYFLFSAPVIGLLSHPATYILALIFLVLFALVQKSYRFLIPALPLVLSAGVILLAPVIQWHPRYAFPIIYTIPVLIAYFIYLNKEAKRG